MLDEAEISAGLEAIFRREPTESEVEFYSTEFSTPRAAFVSAATSDAADEVRTVIAFYQVFYGRVPDADGLDFWTNLYRDASVSVVDLGGFFATATEYEERFAGLSNPEIVATLYQENLNRQAEVAGLQFWTDQLNQGNITVADLGRFFATSNEIKGLIDAQTTAFLVNAGSGNQDYEGSIFDEVTEASVFVTEEPEYGRTLLALYTSPGATTVEGAPIVVAGDPDEKDTLRLVGDADVRIDLTDPREIIEQMDLDGDGINPGETDFNVRGLFDVSFFEIIDAHPRGAALLDPTDSVNGFTGDLYFDGTGFDGTGFNMNGNIVLGGYGEDVIFTGNGNDFVSTGGLDDEIKTGRNADFIYQELSRLDDAFSGDDGEIDGGATFDDDPAQDSDWLLLEASDDEEPVTVALQSASLVEGIDSFDDLLALLDGLVGISSPEDNGVISTRLGNDSARISNIENVNASGNFYKFFEEAVSTTTTSAFVGFGAFINADEAASTSNGFTFITEAGNVTVTRGEIEAFNDGAGVQSVEDLRVLTQQQFDAQFGEGVFEVPLADEENEDGPTDLTGPIVQVNAIGDVAFTSIPALATTQDELARGNLLIDVDTETFQSDLFFGDNRDFSPEEAQYRVPGLSPGVTAQMVIIGSDPNEAYFKGGFNLLDGFGEGVGVSIGNLVDLGSNILIAGYDNDFVAGLGGNDLLMGEDLEFLLTHQHNPNLFDTEDGTISVNGQDGIADGGRDTLVGGTGADHLVWEADEGAYTGSTSLSAFDDDEYEDTLWVTAFSVGRLTSVDRSTDGSRDEFLAVNGIGAIAEQDLTGEGEATDEIDTLNALTEDLVLRFDLGVGAGFDYQGNGQDLPFDGDLAGADRRGTADQTNYKDGFEATTVVNVEHINASGLGEIDYLAAGVPGDTGTDLFFENRQNYRGTNADLDLRGVDLDNGSDGGSTVIAQAENDLFKGGLDNDFTTYRLAAQFNTEFVQADGSALADLLYSTSGDGVLSENTWAGHTMAENKLFASRGDDVIEGRGGDDWLEGREGNDVFIVSTHDGDGATGFQSVDGDNIKIIARRLDADEDGLVDEVDGSIAVGQDFRPGAPGTEQTTFITVEIQPIGAFNVPGAPDNWSNFISLTFTLTNGTELTVEVGPVANATAATIAPLLQAELNAVAGNGAFTVTAGPATEDPDTSETDLDGVFVDAVFIRYNPDVTGVTGEPVATFTSTQNAGFGLQTDTEVVETPTPGDLEDDEIVFRSYQNRFDDESVPDRQVTLGDEAYAEDLVVGVQNGTTKLVEGQEYRIYVEDLKENDTVSVVFNGKVYSRTVEFSGNESQSTFSFLSAFADQINDEIARDPHGRDGGIFVEVQFSDDSDEGILVVREREFVEDGIGAENVFIQFPQVSIVNRSGGDAPSWVVKETSDTSVVLYDYDFRDEDSDGLNRGVGVNEQRDGGTFSTTDTRFITFEDTSGTNRSILQNAAVAGGLVEGLDVVAFDVAGPGVDFEADVFDVSELDELLIQDAVRNDPPEAFLLQVQQNVPGGDNAGSNGLGDVFSALHGDDLLIGGNGTDTILARTGDDRVIASRTATTSANDREFLNGGVNIVVDENGVIQEVALTVPNGRPDDRGNNSGLLQEVRVQEDDELPPFNDALITFTDTLLLQEGIDSNGDDVFNVGTTFEVILTGISEDFSYEGEVEVDENGDGTIDHYIDFTNFEIVRTLSDTENDTLTLAFGGILDANGDGADDDVYGGALINLATGQVSQAFVDDADLDTFVTEGFITALGFENVSAGNGADTIIGTVQDNVIDGNGGDDVIIGGEGADTLTGGDNPGNDADTDTDVDTFVYNAVGESTFAVRDVITDFDPAAGDLISHYTGLTGYVAALPENAFGLGEAMDSDIRGFQSGGNTRVVFDSGNTIGVIDDEDLIITLNGVLADDLSDANFVFNV